MARSADARGSMPSGLSKVPQEHDARCKKIFAAFHVDETLETKCRGSRSSIVPGFRKDLAPGEVGTLTDDAIEPRSWGGTDGKTEIVRPSALGERKLVIEL